jgi:general secretion pathway protein G
MAIYFSCPECGNQIAVADVLSGRNVSCYKCGLTVLVPKIIEALAQEPIGQPQNPTLPVTKAAVQHLVGDEPANHCAQSPHSAVSGTSGIGNAGLVLGIMSLCLLLCTIWLAVNTSLFWYGAIAAIVVGFPLGISALCGILTYFLNQTANRTANRSEGKLPDKGLAKVGLVLLILTILAFVSGTVLSAGVVIVALFPQQKGARIDTTNLKLKSIETAIEAYNVNVGHYPNEQEGGLEALRTKPFFASNVVQYWSGPYLKEEPLDSWGNKFNYQLSQPGTPEADLTPFKLWSNGPDGLDGTEDDIKNWSDATAVPAASQQTAPKWQSRANTIDGLLEEAARIDTTTLKLKSLETGIEAYNVNVGHYPNAQEGGLNALRIKPSFNTAAMGQNWRGPYLKEEPLDSWGNKFNYQISPPGLPEGNLLPFNLWSNGPDGISGTADDIKNWFGGT